ncbi:ABC transporter substrate-binding protein [Sphingobium aquiterrae]|uniref:ABC transporter substrate-binding protein n=1 Tax=Sphingobium aquiterrae TaxID=2038656 RepID=UPI0030168785
MNAEPSTKRAGRRAALILAVALLLGALIAIGLLRPVPGREDVPVLRVGNQKGTTRALLEASGVLKNIPYRIEWSEFPAAQHLLEALTANATDVGFVGDAPFLFSFAGGSPLKVVAIASLGNNGSSVGILVPENSPIRSVRDLRGRKVATGKISIGHYLLLRALEKNGMTAADIQPVYLAPNDALGAFSAGSVDAWATWAPFLDAALLQGKARTLVDGSGLVTGYGYHVASPDAIARKSDLLRDFDRRIARAYAWANGHEQAYGEALAKATGMPLAVALSYARRNNPRSVAYDGKVLEDARQVVRTIGKSEGVQVRDRNIEDAFARDFLRQ